MGIGTDTPEGVIDVRSGNRRMVLDQNNNRYVVYGNSGDDQIYFDFDAHNFYLYANDNSYYHQGGNIMEWGNGGGGYIYSQNSIFSQSYVGNELLQSSASYFVVNASNGAASLLLNKDNASLIQRNIANDADLLVNDEAQFAVNYPNGINGLFFNKTVSAFQQTNSSGNQLLFSDNNNFIVTDIDGFDLQNIDRATGEFVLFTKPSSGNPVERFNISGSVDCADAFFTNANFSVKKDNSTFHGRVLLADVSDVTNHGFVLMGDIDNVGNHTQLFVDDDNMKIDAFVHNGLGLHWRRILCPLKI